MRLAQESSGPFIEKFHLVSKSKCIATSPAISCYDPFARNFHGNCLSLHFGNDKCAPLKTRAFSTYPARTVV